MSSVVLYWRKVSDFCIEHLKDSLKTVSRRRTNGPFQLKRKPSLVCVADDISDMHAGIKNSPEVAKKLLDSLQNDLRTISSDSKRKHPEVKEVRGKMFEMIYALYKL